MSKRLHINIKTNSQLQNYTNKKNKNVYLYTVTGHLVKCVIWCPSLYKVHSFCTHTIKGTQLIQQYTRAWRWTDRTSCHEWLLDLLHPRYQIRFLVHSWVQLTLKPLNVMLKANLYNMQTSVYFLFNTNGSSYWREPSVVVVIIKNRKSWWCLLQKIEKQFYWSGMN